MLRELLRVREAQALRIEAALHAGLLLVERGDQYRQVIDLGQLLVRAQADDGTQRQAAAVDVVFMALRLGLVLGAQPGEIFVAGGELG